MTQDKYKDFFKLFRIRIRKASLELNLARDLKGKKKDLCKYSRSKRKTREGVDQLLNGAEDLVTKNMSRVLNTVFSLLFTSMICLQKSPISEFMGKSLANTD